MTGKELIIYILQNDLENEDVLKDGTLLGFITLEEAAAKTEVGVITMKIMYELGMVPGFKIGDNLFFRKDIINYLAREKSV